MLLNLIVQVFVVDLVNCEHGLLMGVNQLSLLILEFRLVNSLKARIHLFLPLSVSTESCHDVRVGALVSPCGLVLKTGVVVGILGHL